MSSPYRDVDIIKQILKILDRTVLELTQLLGEIKSGDDTQDAYKVSVKRPKREPG